ncbi:hypothetical protein KR018_001205 [Drosophila ironensis]|nr:hypothetical protein KR018_001205 [Drosophila ironensis]
MPAKSDQPTGKVPFRFTDERTLLFVQLYGREPCLWNQRQYMRRARNSAYRRIQAGINSVTEPHEANITIEGVKIKIKNLRSGYHQELKRKRSNPGYQPKTPWFAPLHQFLAEYIEKNERSTMSTASVKRLEIRLPKLRPIKMLTEIKPETEDTPSLEMPLDASPTLFTVVPMSLAMEEPPTPPASETKNSAEDTNAPPIPVQGLNTMSEASVDAAIGSMAATAHGLGGFGVGEMRGPDEFTYFGLSVAAQLRNMPLADAMTMQSKIQYMLSMERRRLTGHSTDVTIFNLKPSGN